MAVRIEPPKTVNNADFDLIGYIQEKMKTTDFTDLTDWGRPFGRSLTF